MCCQSLSAPVTHWASHEGPSIVTGRTPSERGRHDAKAKRTSEHELRKVRIVVVGENLNLVPRQTFGAALQQ